MSTTTFSFRCIKPPYIRFLLTNACSVLGRSSACDFVVDEAVQLHGGFGYLRDAEVERHYRDARIMGIGGGTTEIMNEIIAKQLGV